MKPLVPAEFTLIFQVDQVVRRLRTTHERAALIRSGDLSPADTVDLEWVGGRDTRLALETPELWSMFVSLGIVAVGPAVAASLASAPNLPRTSSLRRGSSI